jgi:ribonuclease HI
MISLETAEKALKSLYLGVISEQLNLGTNPLVAKIQQTTSDVFGKDIIKMVSYGINGGIGAGLETGDLPLASGNNYAQFRVELKNLFGTIEITDKAIRASENTAGAFVNLLNAEMEGLLKASKFNFGRMVFGDGSGYIGTCSSSDNTDKRKITVTDTKNFLEGMIVDIYNSSGNIETGKTKVLKVDRSSGVITVSANTATLTSSHTVYLQGSKGLELTGLGAIFGNADNLYGLSKADNPWLKPTVINGNGAPIAASTVQYALDNAEEKYGASADIIISSYGLRRAMVEEISANRLNVDYQNLDGGYKALSFSGIPWVADRFVAANALYALNSEDFKLHQLCDWRWLEGESGKVLNQISNKAAYKATLVKYADLICERPCGQVKITNVTGS